MKLSDETTTVLALSGGGIRAMAFHMGTLRHLAEHGALERVHRISSVSGGSLLVGLIFQEGGYQWPTSTSFIQEIYPTIRRRLCSQSMMRGVVCQLLNPLNWRFALSRTNLLARTLRSAWSIAAPLSALPTFPEWSINGTNAENGRRFRFKHDTMGDYLSGYAHPNHFPLANAMAVSAAFPGGFGPLTLKTGKFTWKKRDWNAPAGTEKPVATPSRLHLYDGGVYDNLGLEPFFDASTAASRDEKHAIVVSDAGMPLPQGFSFGPFNPFRLKRVADIMSDQSHALRIRTFMHFLNTVSDGGALIQISTVSTSGGATVRDAAAKFPTTLRKLTMEEFDLLADHAYALARDHLMPQSQAVLVE